MISKIEILIFSFRVLILVLYSPIILLDESIKIMNILWKRQQRNINKVQSIKVLLLGNRTPAPVAVVLQCSVNSKLKIQTKLFKIQGIFNSNKSSSNGVLFQKNLREFCLKKDYTRRVFLCILWKLYVRVTNSVTCTAWVSNLTLLKDLILKSLIRI